VSRVPSDSWSYDAIIGEMLCAQGGILQAGCERRRRAREKSVFAALSALVRRALTENQWQMWWIHLQGLVRAVLDSSAVINRIC
jgi:hypothetical protein